MFFYNVVGVVDSSYAEHVLDRRDETGQPANKYNDSLCTFQPPQSVRSLHTIFYHRGVMGTLPATGEGHRNSDTHIVLGSCRIHR